jgi:hypothetical protein
MPFPGEFALRRSRNIDRPAQFGPNDFKMLVHLIQARRIPRQPFENGDVRGKYESISDPDMIVTQKNEGKESYREWPQKAVSGGYSFPPPERPPPECWATTFAKGLGCDITAHQARTLAGDLSA